MMKKVTETMMQTPLHSPLHYTCEQWKLFVAEWQKSGLSWKSYCRKTNLFEELSRDEKHFKVGEELLSSSKPKTVLQTELCGPKIEITLSQGHNLSIEGSIEWREMSSFLTLLLKRR